MKKSLLSIGGFLKRFRWQSGFATAGLLLTFYLVARNFELSDQVRLIRAELEQVRLERDQLVARNDTTQRISIRASILLELKTNSKLINDLMPQSQQWFDLLNEQFELAKAQGGYTPNSQVVIDLPPIKAQREKVRSLIGNLKSNSFRNYKDHVVLDAFDFDSTAFSQLNSIHNRLDHLKNKRSDRLETLHTKIIEGELGNLAALWPECEQTSEQIHALVAYLESEGYYN